MSNATNGADEPMFFAIANTRLRSEIISKFTYRPVHRTTTFSQYCAEFLTTILTVFPTTVYVDFGLRLLSSVDVN